MKPIKSYILVYHTNKWYDYPLIWMMKLYGYSIFSVKDYFSDGTIVKMTGEFEE